MHRAVKSKPANFVTSLNATYFQNSFTDILSSKAAVVIIPPHMKRVVTLPCDISVFKTYINISKGRNALEVWWDL